MEEKRKKNSTEEKHLEQGRERTPKLNHAYVKVMNRVWAAALEGESSNGSSDSTFQVQKQCDTTQRFEFGLPSFQSLSLCQTITDLFSR